MTLLFVDQPYDKEFEATVTAVDPEAKAVKLDRTLFYPTGGGQPGDSGTLMSGDSVWRVVDTKKSEDPASPWHLVEGDANLPEIGGRVRGGIDWPRRHRHMRMHTALHLLCSLVEGDVTGGQIGAEKSRLDFNIPGDAVDKEALTDKLRALVAADLPVASRWITDEELETNPHLVRTMSVKPPTGAGKVRLLQIGGEADPADLQPCGGTHVARTGEIGAVRVAKIENKGKQNRRIAVVIDD